MQLSTFPLIPGLPAGVPAGAPPAATTTVGTGASADSAAGFGDLLTAESAAATPAQRMPAAASGPAMAAHARTALNPASTNGRPGGLPLRGASFAGIGNGAAVALPASSGTDTAAASPAMGSVETASGASIGPGDGAPMGLIPETTTAETSVLDESAVQPQVMGEWIAPVVPESGLVELFGFRATPGSGESAEGAENGGCATTTALSLGSVVSAQPTTLSRAAGVHSARLPVASSTGVPTASDPSVVNAGASNPTPTSPRASATPGGLTQLAPDESDGSLKRSPAQAKGPEAGAVVSDAAVAAQPKARGRTVVPIRSTAEANDLTAVANLLPRSVSINQSEKSATAVVQDATAERGLPAPTTGSADAAASKLTQASGLVANNAEKIAAGFRQFDGGQGSAERQDQRNSLLADGKSVRTTVQRFGTNTAKTEPPMVASAQTTRSYIAEPEATSLSAVPLTFDALVEEATQAVEQSGSARKAVDAAMSLLDQSAKGTQRSVNLQFSVSGVDVAVRVELRDDQVHTTFRTDSPELRAALAQEWQTVVSTQSADRSQKLVEPIFTSNANSGATSGDGGASQQREPSTRQGQWENDQGFASSFASRGSENTPSAESQPVRTVRPETTRHLDAVA